ncbi:YqcC family protein [Orbaceae bacterium ESL0721]|nr:YqcC family protein [Orbaceae bacterium ESL0721]
MNYEKIMQQQLALIKQEMQKINLWQGTPPTEEAFRSEQPFALDSMQADEWLQWIFIPKMEALIDAKSSLPRNFALFPYFEEAFKDYQEREFLLNLIKELDQLSANHTIK